MIARLETTTFFLRKRINENLYHVVLSEPQLQQIVQIARERDVDTSRFQKRVYFQPFEFSSYRDPGCFSYVEYYFTDVKVVHLVDISSFYLQGRRETDIVTWKWRYSLRPTIFMPVTLDNYQVVNVGPENWKLVGACANLELYLQFSVGFFNKFHVGLDSNLQKFIKECLERHAQVPMSEVANLILGPVILEVRNENFNCDSYTKHLFRSVYIWCVTSQQNGKRIVLQSIGYITRKAPYGQRYYTDERPRKYPRY